MRLVSQLCGLTLSMVLSTAGRYALADGPSGYPPLPPPGAGPSAASTPSLPSLPASAVPAPSMTAAPTANGARPALLLSSAQVASIAELVDESPEQVRDRLQEEPALAPLVLNAVEARQARKRAGRTMAIVGFTILGIAETVGLILVIGSYRTDSSGIHADWSQYAAGLGIELGGLGIGLPIGIPGIVKLAKPTDVEKAAVHEYRGPDPSTPESPSGPPPPSEGTVMMLPLVSLSF